MSLSETLSQWVRSSVFFQKESNLSSRQKWILGLVNLGSVVIFWVSSSFLVSDLFDSDVYRKPFMITYLNTACFTLYFIPYLKLEGLGVSEFVALVKAEYSNSPPAFNDIETVSYGSGSDVNEIPPEPTPDLKVGILETISLSLKFCALWFAANLATNCSLSYTSVASQTILSSTCSFFTLIIGFVYGVEKVTRSKIYGIVLCFVGVVIVTRDDSSATNPATSNWLVLMGNLMALIGALIYGIYTILLKMKTVVKNSTLERELNTHLFFAFVGIFTLVILFPVMVILHFTGVERFVLPTNKHALTSLSINMLITLISDFCWCRAVLLTSPLTVTVGLSLTIPLAMVGDWVLKGFQLNLFYISGAAIVTIGFLIINHDEEQEFSHNHIE
ncbi:hypothetical protein PSN45_000256 [Yamadazyma tenuis]|uniref:EamA domain-containing protein n=1 Tax=Candida tenuis (strain ATCC 10573 / BCRC 21748 / CBS 615 / JCM 9827 / NBRC 10315 / NRRL Y-1498 / VKM Y-70) TaxID=590646 RepID=G3BBN1_CANTC|nr:uncharacterized protein CANTEDRAFT_115041 [Yamadazyma tenuis ATCC 10573]EGV62570.1 hypothetical protein CANTEDRAFT_115041 [Yamadazyma tenuis ATCC 10573]WEJ92800.1 hypothetical protein PSN45_000256 [Yamadazyma tenuis]